MLVALPGLSPPLVTFKIKLIRWNGDGNAWDGKGIACEEAVVKSKRQSKCLTASQKVTPRHKPSLERLAFTSVALRFFSLYGKDGCI